MLKKASWTTSAGFADFYVLQTTSPDYNGDYSNLSVFVVDKSEIIAKPEEWDAMGLRGNQSGTLLLDWKFVPADQLVGEVGDGAFSNDESVDPNFLIGSSGTWNGISLGAIDIASGTPRARPTRTWACGCATTRPSRTRSARPSWTPTPRVC